MLSGSPSFIKPEANTVCFIPEDNGTLLRGLVSFAQSKTWPNIHLGTAILCSCLPTYRPLFPRISALARTLRDRYNSILRPSRHTEENNLSDEESLTPRARYAKITGGHDHRKIRTGLAASVGQVDHFEERGYPLNSIEVSHTVDVV